MGSYLNPGNEKFLEILNSEIYVDKTELIRYCNRVLNTLQKYICMSRPRRFGKSVTANMLAAYYSRGCDSGELFSPYKIASHESFALHRNQYNVLFLNMQEFLSRAKSMENMLEFMQGRVLRELRREYPKVDFYDPEDMIGCMQDIYEEYKVPFVIIIDEWDCIFREYQMDAESQRQYLDFLRDMLKDKSYVALGYMTGILPIKKYGTHSALNMFDEFSMIFAGPLAEYMGFTEAEVQALCDTYHMDFDETKQWYDGYFLENAGAIYNPRSVVSAMHFHKFAHYWNQTETFEALRTYLDMNFEGLKDDVVYMMNGKNRIPVDTRGFTNDMVTFRSKDDVMTLLVHLGYLGYLSETGEVFIPNLEIRNEYATAVGNSDWGEVSKALKNSRMTLEAIWNRQEEKVAEYISKAHYETSHLQYHDENALSYTLSLALYVARNYYAVYRELPTGKGVADLVYIPRKQFPEYPALVVELKWNRSAQSAIEQVKRKEYVGSLEEYHGNMLLVGVSYDRRTRKHSCVIEEYKK